MKVQEFNFVCISQTSYGWGIKGLTENEAEQILKVKNPYIEKIKGKQRKFYVIQMTGRIKKNALWVTDLPKSWNHGVIIAALEHGVSKIYK